MTEKRFEYNYVEGAKGDYIYDVEDNRMMWELDCICELLNNLHEENQQLQSRINDYDVALKTLQDLCERKLKRNEQLKQQIEAKDKIIELYYEMVKE